MNPLTSHLREHWPRYALLLLLVAGFAVRLIYAVPDLSAQRFWDERVGLWNFRSLLVEGEIRPHNMFYPTLSYLPHAGLVAVAEGLHRATGIEALEMIDPEGQYGLSEGAVLVARTVSVLAGTLTIALVFALGRRLASPLVGLVAAGIVSASATHLWVSVKFKPDVLAVLFAVVAFWWILDALERPTAARFALAGVGVGLSASSKYLGASLAIPLVVAALWGGWRELKTWARLALAGAATLVTFVLLNPWLGLIVDSLSRTQRDYDAKAARAGATHWSVFLEQAQWIVQDHRPVVAVFVALGVAGLALRAAGVLGGRPGRTAGVAVLAAFLGHSAFYAFSTAHFRDWNYLPVLPFTAFAGAWAMVGVSEWSVARLPGGVRQPLRTTLWGTVMVLFLAFPASWIYTSWVPTTWEVARRSLEDLDGSPAVLVYGEGVRAEIEREHDPPRFVFVEMESLQEVPADRLARADALVFPARVLEGPAATYYGRWATVDGASETRIGPAWFRRRGPALVLVRNPWRLEAGVLHRTVDPPPEGETAFTVPLDRPLEAGDTVSLAIRVERFGRARLPGAVGVRGAGEAGLYPVQPAQRTWMVTPKFQVRRPASGLALDLRGPKPPVKPLEVKLYRWERAR